MRQRWGRIIIAMVVAVAAGFSLYVLHPPGFAEDDPPQHGILVQQVRHEQCGHITETVTYITQNCDVEAITDGWTVVEDDGYRLVVARDEPGLCNVDRTFRHLRLAGDQIEIYYGLPDPDAILSHSIVIERAWLLPEDVQRLEQGVVVVGEEGVQSYLEGLAD